MTRRLMAGTGWKMNMTAAGTRAYAGALAPLLANRLVEPDVERDADRVGVFLGVVQARHEGHDRLLGDDQPKSELRRYRAAAVHRQSNLNLGRVPVDAGL